MLTILTPESETASFCGRLKVISSGKSNNFKNLEELYQLIVSELDGDPAELLIDHSREEDSETLPDTGISTGR